MLWSVLFLIILPIQAAKGKDAIRVGDFSSSVPGSLLPENWEALTFKKITTHTRYMVVEDTHTPVVKAVSDRSASGLIRKIRIDPEQYPVIKWRWKVTNIYQNGDVTQKSGDDYPARIYITFEYNPEKAGFFERAKFSAAKLLYGEYPPSAAINYIWESKAPVGTVVPNPYTDNVQMIVTQSGNEKINTWVEEKRNIFNDYIRAFGKKPPMISGIAIMTDSDNTGEKAISYFGDIVMEPE
ncbi:MAG: DUF3047 domain-containing protein [Desulfobacteraceae bacterium]|nr:DUF3047 domain-containing protein [Desulfobacteraceae bacterium]MBC2755694.1 DUF3047 domain-containing protein [Desulfobacteraceae bacterium]